MLKLNIKHHVDTLNKQVGNNVSVASHPQPLVTPPAWQFQTIPVHSGAEKLLVRGDCDGSIVLWRLMDLQPQQINQLLSVTPVQPVQTKVTLHTSLHQAWAALDPPPVGEDA